LKDIVAAQTFTDNGVFATDGESLQACGGRRLMATPGELVEQLTRLTETVQWHDEQIRVVRQVL
jgi:hypothetical protein